MHNDNGYRFIRDFHELEIKPMELNVPCNVMRKICDLMGAPKNPVLRIIYNIGIKIKIVHVNEFTRFLFGTIYDSTSLRSKVNTWRVKRLKKKMDKLQFKLKRLNWVFPTSLATRYQHDSDKRRRS